MSSSTEVPIPGPKGVPILGNIYDIEPEVPLNSIELLADNYGTATTNFQCQSYSTTLTRRDRIRLHLPIDYIRPTACIR